MSYEKLIISQPKYNYFHPYINLADVHLSVCRPSVCPFVRPSVCPSIHLSICYDFSCIHIATKWNPNFTKPSAYVKFGLPSCFKLFGPVHMTVCMYSTWKCAYYFWLLFCLFFTFWCLPHWKWKNGRHTSVRYWPDATFLFDIFLFHFKSGSPPKCVKHVQKGWKFHFLPLISKIWNLGIKVIK